VTQLAERLPCVRRSAHAGQGLLEVQGVARSLRLEPLDQLVVVGCQRSADRLRDQRGDHADVQTGEGDPLQTRDVGVDGGVGGSGAGGVCLRRTASDHDHDRFVAHGLQQVLDQHLRRAHRRVEVVEDDQHG